MIPLPPLSVVKQSGGRPGPAIGRGSFQGPNALRVIAPRRSRPLNNPEMPEFRTERYLPVHGGVLA